MFLKEISIFGFKSFAAKTVLKFDKGITCVVGPNGSGKSNVADAVRWVLGEQSNKTIRAKKSEDVIFFGSDSKSKSSYAEVVLLFDNSLGRFPLPYKEVSVGRRLYRSGESEYLINGGKGRLSDVIELLARAGIGQSSYTVVGQGMVDHVLASSAVERKEFFDEAAGIKAFELKRDASVRKLDATRANTSRVKDILNELSPRLTALTRAMEKQKERVEIEQKLNILQRDYYASELNGFAGKIAELNKKKTELGKQIHILEEQIDELNEQLKETSKNEPKTFEEIGAVKKQLSSLRDERDGIRERLISAEGRLRLEKEKAGFNMKEKLEADLAKLNAELLEMDEALQGVNAEREAHNGEKAKLSVEVEKARLALSNQKKEYLELLKLVTPNELAKELTEIADIIEKDSKTALSRLRKLADKLKSSDSEKIQEIGHEIAGLEKQLGLLTVREQAAQVSIGRLEEKKSYVSERVKALNSQITNVKKEITDLSSEPTDFSELEDLINSEKANFVKINTALTGKDAELEKLELISRETGREYNEKQRLIFDKQNSLSGLQSQSGSIDVALARVETRLEDTKAEVAELSPELQRIVTENKNFVAEDARAMKTEIDRLRTRLYTLGGSDEVATEEFGEVSERHKFLSEQLQDLEKATGELKKAVAELDDLIKSRFKESFAKIDTEFRKFFSELFSGGNAALSLQEDAETGQLGIEIIASPPGKKIQHLSTLSGGERTLTSIALLSAFLSINPSPFVVLDEVDAALDELNTHRFLKIIRNLSQHTQFITVTHNKETMKSASVLYGVTMGEDHASKIISIKLEEAKEFATA